MSPEALARVVQVVQPRLSQQLIGKPYMKYNVQKSSLVVSRLEAFHLCDPQAHRSYANSRNPLLYASAPYQSF